MRDGAVPETSETNNTYARAIQIGSDLVVSAITVPATTGAGMTITVGDTTANQGGDGAAASVDEVLSFGQLHAGRRRCAAPGRPRGAGSRRRRDRHRVDLADHSSEHRGRHALHHREGRRRQRGDRDEGDQQHARHVPSRLAAISSCSTFTAPTKGGAGVSLDRQRYDDESGRRVGRADGDEVLSVGQRRVRCQATRWSAAARFPISRPARRAPGRRP